MRRLLNQALKLLQNEDTTLEALAKFKQQMKSKKDDSFKKRKTEKLKHSLCDKDANVTNRRFRQQTHIKSQSKKHRENVN